MKVLVLDNYDSFTYNLVHLLRELGAEPDVFRNDKITPEAAGRYDKILLSPGPGVPAEAGNMVEIIRACGPTKSILGVCLGHQGIAEVFGAQLYNLSRVLHGVTSEVEVKDNREPLFARLPPRFRVCHYHSWAVRPESVNGSLKVTAVNENGLVMAIAHTSFDVRGVQFHPESIMTEHGRQIMKNWLTMRPGSLQDEGYRMERKTYLGDEGDIE